MAIVERGDHRLAGAGRRDDEVAVAPLNPTFGVEPVEDLLLERVGPQLERERLGARRFDRPLLLQRPLQPRPLGLVIRLELAVLPVGLEGRGDAVPEMRRLVLADLDRPLQPLGQGRARQVGRADVGGAEAGVAVEQVRLGVQPRAMGVVRDADLGVGQRFAGGRPPSGRSRRGSWSSARAAGPRAGR